MFGGHKIWQMYDPSKALPALAAFLFTLAVLIHFVLLGSERYNWLTVPAEATAQTAQ